MVRLFKKKKETTTGASPEPVVKAEQVELSTVEEGIDGPEKGTPDRGPSRDVSFDDVHNRSVEVGHTVFITPGPAPIVHQEGEGYRPSPSPAAVAGAPSPMPVGASSPVPLGAPPPGPVQASSRPTWKPFSNIRSKNKPVFSANAEKRALEQFESNLTNWRILQPNREAYGFDYVNWKPYGYRRRVTHPGEFNRQCRALIPYVSGVVVSGLAGAEERGPAKLPVPLGRGPAATSSNAPSRDPLIAAMGPGGR